MGDDGVALRVMGRVRPLLGEIALTGLSALPSRNAASGLTVTRGLASPSWLTTALRPPALRSAAQTQCSLVSIVDWIEGVATPDLLGPFLEKRRRVILLDAVVHGASPGSVRHWRLERRARSDLSTVRFYRPAPEDPLDHLAFWLEDDLPEHGTDLIAIEPYRIESGNELSPVIRSRLSSITAQVGGLLVRILEEEGWKISGGGKSPSRKLPRSRSASPRNRRRDGEAA